MGKKPLQIPEGTPTIWEIAQAFADSSRRNPDVVPSDPMTSVRSTYLMRWEKGLVLVPPSWLFELGREMVGTGPGYSRSDMDKWREDRRFIAERHFSHTIDLTCGHHKTAAGATSNRLIGRLGRQAKGAEGVGWILYQEVSKVSGELGICRGISPRCYFCGLYKSPKIFNIGTSRVQAALETQIMGVPRKRISLVALDRIAGKLTSEQVKTILERGIYLPVGK